jgi:predicted DNA-binding transcriptional regulator AlpA
MWVGFNKFECKEGKRMSEHTTKLTETKFSMGQVAKLMGVHRTTIMRLLDAGNVMPKKISLNVRTATVSG